MSKLTVPVPDLQITFFNRLQRIRRNYLIDALLETIGRLEISRIDHQLAEFVSGGALQRVARWGLRGELVFAVPYILLENPKLLGYYRLLLGFSQKQFYGKRYDFGPFKALEERGHLPTRHAEGVMNLCRALCRSGERLVEGVDELSRETVHELTLLTLGPQLRGGALNLYGSRATRKVFDLINSLVQAETVAESEQSLEVQNAAGRKVIVLFAADPDISIIEELPSGKYRNLVAIEIKGGKDYSNIHNRIGEAEKSHQKARKQGYIECWTLVGVSDLPMDVARRESPTTDRFYHLNLILQVDSEEGIDFRENLLARIGLVA